MIKKAEQIKQIIASIDNEYDENIKDIAYMDSKTNYFMYSYTLVPVFMETATEETNIALLKDMFNIWIDSEASKEHRDLEDAKF